MIDGGPARTGRSADRQPMYRPEAVRSQPESPAPVEQPLRDGAGQSRPLKPVRPKKRANGLVIGIIVLALVLIVGAASYLFLPGLRGNAHIEIDGNKYQAVFLSSGQVYFGNLSVVNGDYMKLSGVFYIQSGDNSSQATGEEGELPTSTSGMQLIKLGDEVHGPEDAMVINTDQVLFFENLKSDGSVAKLIDQYKQDNK